MTNALAHFLSLRPYFVHFEEDRPLTPAEAEAETLRLNGLPKPEQIKLFCKVMEFPVLTYLYDKATYNGEVENDIEWMVL